jgi:Domain of unknown function (DUF4386)
MSEGPRCLGATGNDRLARLAGILYLLTLPTAGTWFYTSLAQLGGDGITLSGLNAGRSSLELAIVLGAVGHLLQLFVVVILYRLLDPFGKLAASLMLVLLVISVPLAFAAMTREMNILTVLDGKRGLAVLGAEQMQAQVVLASCRACSPSACCSAGRSTCSRSSARPSIPPTRARSPS